MKFTESMLREYVTTPLAASEIGDLLTMTGFELEEITVVEGENVFDMNIMANRGDGASVLGMSREVLAKDGNSKPTDLYKNACHHFPQNDESQREIWGLTSVAVESPACTRYAARVFEQVQNGSSPDWLQERLRKIGQRPISLLVDLSNYVMFETGQPLHAFDLDKLRGQRIIVRQARPGESIKTLDGTNHELRSHDLVICDGEGPVALAGIMGGEETEVSAATTRCLLESAHFSNVSVRKTRKELGLFTEASYRFERHVDPDFVVAALNRFLELYVQITGKRSVGGIIDIYPSKPVQKDIHVRIARAKKLLGMPVSIDEAKSYLDRLGFEVNLVGPETLEVTPPTWRIDVLREEDVIEEIGRVHGYDKIPEALPQGSTRQGGVHGFDAVLGLVRESFLRSGFDEAVSYSMRDVHPLDAPGGRIRVRNPHSPEIALMRNSLLPFLAEAALRNGGQNLHLFEIGHVFSEQDEEVQVALLSQGEFEPASWRPRDTSRADFYTLKGAIEALRPAARIDLRIEASSSDPRLHPTRQAQVVVGGVSVGSLGQIHPLIAEKAGLPGDTMLAELTLSRAKESLGHEPSFTGISRNPAARRDIAIVIAKEVPYAEVEAALAEAGGDRIEKHWLFDVYDGQNIPDGFHSLGIAVQLRKQGNFTDEEANQVRDEIVRALEALGAKQR